MGQAFFGPKLPEILLDILLKKGYTTAMKLNARQMEIATAIREITQVPDNESWGDFTDLMRAFACMIEGSENLVKPKIMQQHFQHAWDASAKLWMFENNRILRDCLGGQEDFDRVAEHPNGRDAFGRILQRVREVHGNLSPGMVVAVNVDDILEELDIV